MSSYVPPIDPDGSPSLPVDPDPYSVDQGTATYDMPNPIPSPGPAFEAPPPFSAPATSEPPEFTGDGGEEDFMNRTIVPVGGTEDDSDVAD